MTNNKKSFKIYYNDGVFAEAVTFTNKSRRFINKFLLNEIKEFNENINKQYHINFKNIIRVY